MSNIIIDSFRFGASSPVAPSLGYGLLYNWYAATDARGVAPAGFRVGGESDYSTLYTQQGNNTFSLKGNRTDPPAIDPYWLATLFAFNPNGFDLFGSGIRESDGSYESLRVTASIVTTTIVSESESQVWIMTGGGTGAGFQNEPKQLGGQIRCVSDTEPATTLVQDADGNNYSWVLIGAQYWLVQSLKTTKYNNGDSIVTGLDNAAWAATTDGAWAYPNGDSSLPI